MVLAFVAVTAVLGASRVRGFASLALGLMIGLVGIDATTGQQRLTFGLPLLADGIDVVVVAVGIFAVGEALWVAAHLRRTPAQIIPVGRAWMGKDDWKRSWKPWLRGTAFGFPFGALPGGRCGDPHLPVLRHGEEALQAPRGVRPRRHRGRRRPGGDEQRLRGRDAGADAGAGSAGVGDLGGDAGGISDLRHPARAAAVRPRTGAGVGADRQPVHRQRTAADTEPAAGPVLGEAAVDPAALPLRGDPVLRQPGRVRGERSAVRPGRAAGPGRARVRHAPLRPARSSRRSSE